VSTFQDDWEKAVSYSPCVPAAGIFFVAAGPTTDRDLEVAEHG